MTCPAPWPSPCCCPPLLRPCLLLLFCSRQLCVRTCHTCYKYLEEHIYLHRRWSLRRPLRRLDALNLLHNSAQNFAFAQATIKCSFKPDFFSPATTQPVFKLSSMFLLIAARTTRCFFRIVYNLEQVTSEVGVQDLYELSARWLCSTPVHNDAQAFATLRTLRPL